MDQINKVQSFVVCSEEVLLKDHSIESSPPIHKCNAIQAKLYVDKKRIYTEQCFFPYIQNCFPVYSILNSDLELDWHECHKSALYQTCSNRSTLFLSEIKLTLH